MKHLIASGIAVFTVASLAGFALWKEKDKPTLTLDAKSKDLGKAEEGKDLIASFKITNSGWQPLKVFDVKTDCGCTDLSWTQKLIEPGQSADLSVHVDTAMKQGHVTKQIRFASNDPNMSFGAVFIEADVENMHSAMGENGKAKIFTEEKCMHCHVDMGVGAFGKDLFDGDCAMCHRMQEESKILVGPALEKGSYTDPAYIEHVRQVISYGSKTHRSMPGFLSDAGGPLTKEQIDSLVNYLKSLKASEHGQSALPMDDKLVRIQEDKRGREVRLFALSDNISEASILMELSGENVQLNPARPTWSRFSRGMPGPIATVSFDPAYRYNYKWNYKYIVGTPGGSPNFRYVYDLPFKKGFTTRICTAYREKTHVPGTPSEYALDFAAPEGTPVCAARDGVVVGYRNDSNVGGVGDLYKSKANFVFLKHDDGTYSEYAHLKYNGVLVRLNQRVQKGQIIGLSGDTGMSSGPHLHFCVFYVDNNYVQRSTPIYLQSRSGIQSVFVENKVLEN